MSTIVVDLSSANMIEAGIAGEQQQKAQINRSATSSVITDMVKFEDDLRRMFSDLGVNSKDHKVFMTVPSLGADKTVREKMTSLMFETFEVPAFFLMPESLLGLYGTGTITGTVVLCNAEATVISCCYHLCLLSSGKVENGSDYSIGDAIHGCIAKSDMDIRPDLFGNIIVLGDNVPSSSIVQEWRANVTALAPLNVNVKLNVPDHYQNLIWQGGSMLASSPSMESFWFTQAEYQSYGAPFVHRKCSQ